jgi:FMN phosphatase YigB (HAD superfamily)
MDRRNMKFVALDVGNVLVHANFQNFIEKLSKTFNLTMSETLYFMNRNQKLHDMGLTRMRDELGDHFKIKSEVLMDELIQDWNGVITANKNMLKLMNVLKNEHDIKIAILSNVGSEHLVRMKEVLDYDGFMDGTVGHFSCLVGARKPQMVYYHTFLQLHPEWHGCPYIDDIQENLDMGAQFGFKPFKFSLEEFSSHNHAEDVSPATDAFKDKLAEIKKFILDNNKPQKNSRRH